MSEVGKVIIHKFYGTEIEIWAGLGPVGNTEKKIGADYEQHLWTFFIIFSWAIFFKNIVLSALKSSIK